METDDDKSIETMAVAIPTSPTKEEEKNVRESNSASDLIAIGSPSTPDNGQNRKHRLSSTPKRTPNGSNVPIVKKYRKADLEDVEDVIEMEDEEHRNDRADDMDVDMKSAEYVHDKDDLLLDASKLHIKKKALINKVRDTDEYKGRDEYTKQLLSQIPQRSLRSMIPKKNVSQQDEEGRDINADSKNSAQILEKTATKVDTELKELSIIENVATTTDNTHEPHSSVLIPPKNISGVESSAVINTPSKPYSGSARLVNLKTPGNPIVAEESETVSLDSSPQPHLDTSGEMKGETMRMANLNGVVMENDESAITKIQFYEKSTFWFIFFFICHVTISLHLDIPITWQNVPSMSKKTMNYLYDVTNYNAEPPTASNITENDNDDNGNDDTCDQDLSQTETLKNIAKKQLALENLLKTKLITMIETNLVEKQKKQDTDAIDKLLSSPTSISISSSDFTKKNTNINIEILEKNLLKKNEILLQWEKKLINAEEFLDDWFDSDEPTEYTNAQKTFEDLFETSPIPVTSFLLNCETVIAPGDGCKYQHKNVITNTGNQVNKLEYLTRAEFNDSKEYIVELAQATSVKLTSDPKLLSSVRKWVNSKVINAAKQNGLELAKDITLEEPTFKQETWGMPSEMIQENIDLELEKEAADSTGKRDYASLQTGSSVIRKGSRMTSLSLIDNIPIGNKIFAATKLRFYGHHAEAALIPTHPKYTLGQCWSFEPMSKLDEISGGYATLSINLSQPIHVKSVMIEHPPLQLTKSSETAIKKFRVFGYQDEDAIGYPWELGSFTYDICEYFINDIFSLMYKY